MAALITANTGDCTGPGLGPPVALSSIRPRMLNPPVNILKALISARPPRISQTSERMIGVSASMPKLLIRLWIQRNPQTPL